MWNPFKAIGKLFGCASNNHDSLVAKIKRLEGQLVTADNEIEVKRDVIVQLERKNGELLSQVKVKDVNLVELGKEKKSLQETIDDLVAKSEKARTYTEDDVFIIVVNDTVITEPLYGLDMLTDAMLGIQQVNDSKVAVFVFEDLLDVIADPEAVKKLQELQASNESVPADEPVDATTVEETPETDEDEDFDDVEDDEDEEEVEDTEPEVETDDTPMKKAVNQYSLDGDFIAGYDSVMEAQKATGANESSIRKVLKGKRNSAGGFIWKNC